MSNGDDITTMNTLAINASESTPQITTQEFAEKLEKNPALQRIFNEAAAALYSSVSMGSVVDVSEDVRREKASNVAYGIVERIGELFSSKRGR